MSELGGTTWPTRGSDGARAMQFEQAASEVQREVQPEPTRDEVRAAVAAQMCPWRQDRRVWVSLGMHVAKKHGVSMLDFRNLGGFNKAESICDPEYAARCAAIADARQPWLGNPAKRPNRQSPTYSEVGLTGMRDAVSDVNSKRHAERIPNHGSLQEYNRHGCRCAECIAVRYEYTRQHREKHRDEYLARRRARRAAAKMNPPE